MIPPWIADLEVLYRETCKRESGEQESGERESGEQENQEREGGNGLLVWEALTDCQPDEPLPAWIREYLVKVATGLLAPLDNLEAARSRIRFELSRLHGKPDRTPQDAEKIRQLEAELKALVLVPKEALKRVPAVLELSGRGWNAYAEKHKIEREAAATFAYEHRLKLNPGTSESLVRNLAVALGITPGAVRVWFRNARRRWGAQKAQQMPE